MRNKQSGFTLVEIAIVLVIIGLLLGGVLKGQELINSAKIKNLVNDLNGLSTAVYAYQDRYKGLPGDDAQAATRWVLGVTPPTTTGDGTVQGVFNAVPGAAITIESILFWRELRLAGFVSGDPATGAQPVNAVGGILGVQLGAGIPTAGVTQGLGGFVACQTNVPGRIAESLDTQLDDGKPNTGGTRAWTQTGLVGNDAATTGVDLTPGVGGSATASAYVDDGVTLYTVCKQIL